MWDEFLFDKSQVKKLGTWTITPCTEPLESSYGSNFWASRSNL